MRHPGRLKIAAVSRVTLQHGTEGGLERCLDLVASGLAKKGHDVTLVTTQLPQSAIAPQGIALEPLPSPRLSRRSWREELQRHFQSGRPLPDVILSNSFAAAPLARMNVPIVPLIHGTGLVDLISTFRLFRLGRASPLRLAREMVVVARDDFFEQRRLMLSALRTIAVSAETARSLRRTYGAEANRLRIIPSPVDTRLFEPEMRQPFVPPTPDRPLRLLTAATLSRQKGVDFLVSAFALLTGNGAVRYSLKIAGDGPELGRLREKAAGLPQPSAVAFLGNLGQAAMASQLRETDLFILPTLREEGFPLAISEALASGVPVVAARTGGNPTAVRDGLDGVLVKPGCAEALANAIATLGADVELRRRMSQNARIRAVAELDAAVVADKVERVLYEACRLEISDPPRQPSTGLI